MSITFQLLNELSLESRSHLIQLEARLFIADV